MFVAAMVLRLLATTFRRALREARSRVRVAHGSRLAAAGRSPLLHAGPSQRRQPRQWQEQRGRRRLRRLRQAEAAAARGWPVAHVLAAVVKPAYFATFSGYCSSREAHTLFIPVRASLVGVDWRGHGGRSGRSIRGHAWSRQLHVAAHGTVATAERRASVEWCMALPNSP